MKLTRDAIDVCDAPSRLIRDNRALLSVGFIDPCHVAVVRSIIAPQIRIVMTVEMEHRYLLTQAIFTPPEEEIIPLEHLSYEDILENEARFRAKERAIEREGEKKIREKKRKRSRDAAKQTKRVGIEGKVFRKEEFLRRKTRDSTEEITRGTPKCETQRGPESARRSLGVVAKREIVRPRNWNVSRKNPTAAPGVRQGGCWAVYDPSVATPSRRKSPGIYS